MVTLSERPGKLREIPGGGEGEGGRGRLGQEKRSNRNDGKILMNEGIEIEERTEKTTGT